MYLGKTLRDFHGSHPLVPGMDMEELRGKLTFELSPKVFRPLVETYARTYRLNFETIEQIRNQYARTASLLSTMKAVVKYWTRPAASLTAEYRGRLNSPGIDRALRVSPQGYNERANRIGLLIYPNMRAPIGSPIHQAYLTKEDKDAPENLGNWETSSGDSLTEIDVFTSARCINERVYAVLSA